MIVKLKQYIPYVLCPILKMMNVTQTNPLPIAIHLPNNYLIPIIGIERVWFIVLTFIILRLLRQF